MQAKFLFIFSILIAILAQAEAAVFWMPDSNLQQVVREKLQIPDEISIRSANMLGLYDLVALESDISSLQGLEYAENLKFLHMGRNQISDLSPLTELRNLRVLKLHDNIWDISALAGLVTLQVLQLQYNLISDNINNPVAIDIGVAFCGGHRFGFM